MIPELKDRGYNSPSERKPCGTARILASIPLVAMLVWFSGCAHRDPQAAYDRARRAYQRGDMPAAGEAAENGYKEFHNRSVDWAWRFLILKARVLYWRGMNDDVLRLLASEPHPPLAGDLAVQMYRLRAVAKASSHNFKEAEADLEKAESICVTSTCPACGDLITARGALEMEGDHYLQAQGSFGRALASARVGGDQFLEATALLNLSWSAD